MRTNSFIDWSENCGVASEIFLGGKSDVIFSCSRLFPHFMYSGVQTSLPNSFISWIVNSSILYFSTCSRPLSVPVMIRKHTCWFKTYSPFFLSAVVFPNLVSIWNFMITNFCNRDANLLLIIQPEGSWLYFVFRSRKLTV